MLTTDAIKKYLKNFGIEKLKRISKRKDGLNTLRVFSNGTYLYEVLSDEKDQNIVKVKTNDSVALKNNGVVENHKYWEDPDDSEMKELNVSKNKNLSEDSDDVDSLDCKDYYFCVSKNKTEEDCFEVWIVPKSYWEAEKYPYDSPLQIEEELSEYLIDSPNESSLFNAYEYETSEEVIALLERLGCQYSNEIAEYCESDDRKEMKRKATT